MFHLNKKYLFLNEVDSTNNYANGLVLSNAAEEGTVVLTQFQNRGKGQAGNSWESAPEMNLLASIILFPKFLNAGAQFQISKIISLSIAEFLLEHVPDVSIKWPNDIYVGNKKIAGILIENTVKGNFLDTSVVGFGLNLNQEVFVSDAPNPISLKQLTEKLYSIENTMDRIFDLFSKWYFRLQTSDNGSINSTYLKNLFRFRKYAIYKKDGVEFEARIVGVGDFGQLKLETNIGELKEFMFKEIEFVL